jgi:carboxyl-terminal processing protease
VNSNVLRGTLIGFVSILIAAMLVALGFMAALLTQDAAPAAVAPAPDNGQAASADIDANFGILSEIARILERDYVDPDRADPALLREGAIQGIFRALDDPHSTYVDPETYALSRDDFEGHFSGIGATVSREGDWIVIVRPLPDTPAERAGIEAGAIILEVDGEPAEGWSVQQAVTRIRGPLGTEVTLKLRYRDGTEQEVTVERDEIAVSSVSTDPIGGVLIDSEGEPVDDIAYIRIRSFTRATPQELETAIAEAEAAGVRGIVLDVRSNPGGLLQETLAVADMFLDEGTIIVQRHRDGSEQVAEARQGTVTDLPMVVLQDEFSASGAELLAAALQENGRAVVVGTRSFGKGSVNHVRELSNGGAVYVSIARWLTPDLNQIEGRGILPDVEVETTLDDIEAGRDVATQRAIDILRDQLGG